MRLCLLVLVITTYPITRLSVGPFYIVDIMIISYLLYSLPSIRIRIGSSMKLLWSISFALCVSTLVSIPHGIIKIDNLVFIYKYCMPILLFVSIRESNLNKAESRMLLRSLEVTYFLLVIYVFIYFFARNSGWITGSFRPSFPFAEDKWSSDSHLYASYLITFLSYFFSKDIVFSRRFSWRYLPLYILVFIALVLTGSRNWIIGFFVMVLVTITMSSSIRNRTTIIVAFAIIALLSIFLIGQLERTLPYRIDQIISRVTSADDAGRINKWSIAINQLFNSTAGFLGLGLVSQSGTWYDSILVNALVNLGVIGLAYVLYLVLRYLRRLYVIARTKIEYKVIFVVLSVYLTTNLFTEFILVSRSVVPFVLLIALVQKSSESRSSERKLAATSDRFSK